MASMSATSIWMGRLSFVALALVLMFLRLLPLDTLPPSLAGPDLLLAATLAWCVRQPRLVPVLLVAGVFLLADLLFQQPPGLITALVVIATEMLRRRHGRLSAGGFGYEWATVTVAILGITLATRFVLFVTAATPPPLTLSLIQVLATALAYPFVVLVARGLFGVGRGARIEGRRIRS